MAHNTRSLTYDGNLSTNTRGKTRAQQPPRRTWLHWAQANLGRAFRLGVHGQVDPWLARLPATVFRRLRHARPARRKRLRARRLHTQKGFDPLSKHFGFSAERS